MSTNRRTVVRKLVSRSLQVAVTLAILGAAAFALWHLSRDVKPADVVAALAAQPVGNVLIAGLFVVAGYVTLIFYDVLALRTIGRATVPFRVAALASFTSFTIGHLLGAATLTGGMVRLRVYSAWGLTVRDIAKIALVTGLTFWLGNALVLGGAMSCAPQAASAIDYLPPWMNRVIGLSGLAAIAGYLLWLMPRPRTVGYADWKIALPTPRITLVQVGIGAMDLSLVTLAMYSVLPQNPAVSFVTVVIIFLAASLLGTVSHVPGSLGVIEAALLAGLPQFPKEQLLASLLTFRVVYFLIPLLVAVLGLGLREIGLIAQPAAPSPR